MKDRRNDLLRLMGAMFVDMGDIYTDTDSVTAEVIYKMLGAASDHIQKQPTLMLREKEYQVLDEGLRLLWAGMSRRLHQQISSDGTWTRTFVNREPEDEERALG